jgi:hypothetical protein
MSCSVLDRPNVLSYNLKIDPIKPRNPSRIGGSGQGWPNEGVIPMGRWIPQNCIAFVLKLRVPVA